MFQLHNKLVLIGLITVPVLIYWHFLMQKRGKRFVFFSAKELLVDSSQSLKVRLAKNLFFFKLLALVLFILALARPQLMNYYQVEKRQGIDILITLDISGSMASIDFKPKNRLEVAKDVISNFIDERQNDRIGLVIFAGTSYTKCPLTIDYELLRYVLRETSIGELEDGTALGMALATSVNRIRHAKTKTKIIILLTDGVNNRGEIDPRDAAKIARDFNIKVYAIGVGKRGEARFPITDQFGRRQYIMVNVEIDEALLQQIANDTGGLYFRATDKDSLQQVFSEINRWEKSEVSTKKYSRARDLYPYFILIALIIFSLAEVAKRSFLRTLP
ncbi:MAG: VWA domain-containing protein [Candidatus Aminicenantes bacterium]|nr:VWA domain-containing protein [Candidatus Aminicenantes bacterium]